MHGSSGRETIMNWMFWKKEGQTQKLPGPKEIPPPIGSYLVTQEGMSPDVVWKLMAAISPRLNDKYVVDVRVYDGSKIKQGGFKVENYHSLDDHPDFVIFDGWYTKDTKSVGKRNP